MRYRLTVQEKPFEVEIGAISGDIAEVIVDGKPYTVRIETETDAATDLQAMAEPARPASISSDEEKIVAPIPGTILSIAVKVGDRVAAGQIVAVMEAMKMENNLVCHRAGTVKVIQVSTGSGVATGDVVMVIC